MADDDLRARTTRPPDRTEVTGPEETDVYEVWEPAAGRAPRGVTVGLVDGGFWADDRQRSRPHPLAEALAADGFHVVNLDYPRLGMAGGGWPGCVHSLAARIAAVRADGHLPPPLVLVGHGAGGLHVLWFASDEASADLSGIIGLAPAASLAEVHRLGLGRGAAAALLGSAPDEAPETWAQADPVQRRVVVPTVVLTGDRDDTVPPSVVDAYAVSRAADEPVTFGVVPDAAHDDLVDPGHPAYFTVLAHLEDLILQVVPHTRLG